MNSITIAHQELRDSIIDSPQSFGKAFKVTPQTVRNWCHAGTIPTMIQCGKIIRFERSAALAALAAKGKVGAA